MMGFPFQTSWFSKRIRKTPQKLSQSFWNARVSRRVTNGKENLGHKGRYAVFDFDALILCLWNNYLGEGKRPNSRCNISKQKQNQKPTTPLAKKKPQT